LGKKKGRVKRNLKQGDWLFSIVCWKTKVQGWVLPLDKLKTTGGVPGPWRKRNRIEERLGKKTWKTKKEKKASLCRNLVPGKLMGSVDSRSS